MCIENFTFDQVFTFSNLYKSYKNCCKNINWKTSTKNYVLHALQNLSKAYKDLHEEKYKHKSFNTFIIKERGKCREIKALHIYDRVIQKCFCDYFLVPLLVKRLIYDNGACMKNKGLTFSCKRLKCHLQQYYRKNNTNLGYILTFDFSKFFESINHKILLEKIKKLIYDKRLFNLYEYFVNSFEGETGLGLGSQISQISALFYTNDLDHFLKEKMHMKYYGRYMDDGYIICNSKEKLKECIEVLKIFSDRLKLNLNLKKTKIWRIDKGFIFLNRHWVLKKTNFIKIWPNHKTLYRLKKRYKKIKNVISLKNLNQYKASINGFLKFFKNKRIINYVYN